MKLKSVVDGPILQSKSVVDRPILHSKSIVDRSILHCKAKVCAFSKVYYGKIINIPYRYVCVSKDLKVGELQNL